MIITIATDDKAIKETIMDCLTHLYRKQLRQVVDHLETLPADRSSKIALEALRDFADKVKY